MSEALKALKGRERTTVDNLAHCLVMIDLERNVEGMKGVFASYMEKASGDQRRQWQALQERVKEVRVSLCEHIEKEGNQ